jgi:integral membrane sensor domain MASE1
LALIVTVALAVGGWRIWRLGAVLLSLGSILAYAYFAGQVDQADVVGLVVKIVEVAAVAAAVRPVIAARRRVQERHQRIPSG